VLGTAACVVGHAMVAVWFASLPCALAFFAAESAPAVQTARREIRPQELKQRIDEREHMPFVVWDGRVRPSIAGYQDKLAVYLDPDNRMYLVEGELASTHILKPEPADKRLPLLVANEHFSMSLARWLGPAVASVSILRIPDAILVVERFDRAREEEHSTTRGSTPSFRIASCDIDDMTILVAPMSTPSARAAQGAC
jgi:serine/threonine-protein kinase HipA